jgi:tetratricopeptide (TPR) repeat protein
MFMHPSWLILLIGLLYILGFGALSSMRRQGLSTRFAIEGLIVTAIGAVLPLLSISINFIFFLAVIYLVTMRVRLLVDLGNWLTSRKQYKRALAFYEFALRLGSDDVSRQIVLINRGVTELKMQEPEAAYLTLKEVLTDEEERIGAKYLAAGYYNLGLACYRTKRKAEAVRRFNEAIDILPNSIYARAAQLELEKHRSDYSGR